MQGPTQSRRNGLVVVLPVEEGWLTRRHQALVRESRTDERSVRCVQDLQKEAVVRRESEVPALLETRDLLIREAAEPARASLPIVPPRSIGRAKLARGVVLPRGFRYGAQPEQKLDAERTGTCQTMPPWRFARGAETSLPADP
jgi:hypothetical protein